MALKTTSLGTWVFTRITLSWRKVGTY